MPDFSILDEEYRQLVRLHKRTPNRRRADRIKAVLWLADGLSVEWVAKLFFVDDVTVRRWYKKYREGGEDWLIQIRNKGGGPQSGTAIGTSGTFDPSYLSVFQGYRTLCRTEVRRKIFPLRYHVFTSSNGIYMEETQTNSRQRVGRAATRVCRKIG